MNRYEIRVAGHLDQRRARTLGCQELRLLPSGESLLISAAIDQAALYGLLTRLRDAGLGLIAARRIPTPEPTDVGGRTAERSEEHSDAAD